MRKHTLVWVLLWSPSYTRGLQREGERLMFSVYGSPCLFLCHGSLWAQTMPSEVCVRPCESAQHCKSYRVAHSAPPRNILVRLKFNLENTRLYLTMYCKTYLCVKSQIKLVFLTESELLRFWIFEVCMIKVHLLII